MPKRTRKRSWHRISSHGEDAQKGQPAVKNLSGLPKAIRLAQEMGAGLGKRHLLLKTLPVTSQVNQAHRANAL
jgi:hypothetical protein